MLQGFKTSLNQILFRIKDWNIISQKERGVGVKF
jgi:hypothetical protein